MKFSIIIPCYNSEKYIEKCLRSIFNQTLNKKEYEVIIIDDGCTDNTIKIAQNYPAIFLKTSRRKAGGARNKGIDNAKGEYLIFLDSDDELYSNDCLEKLFNFIKDEDLIYLPLITTNSKTGELEIRKMAPSTTKEDMIANTTLLGPAYRCIRKETLGDIHFTEEIYYEDVLYAMKIMCKAEKISCFEDTFYKYNKHLDSMTHSSFSIEKQIDFISDALKLIKLATTYPKYFNAIMQRLERIDINKRMNDIYIQLNEEQKKYI